MTTTTNNKSATSEQKKLLSEGQYKITIGAQSTNGTHSFTGVVQTSKGIYNCTLSNTKPTTHLKYTDNNGNKFDILLPTYITIDGKQVTSKFLTQNEFAKFMFDNHNKTFTIDKNITAHAKTKAKKLDLRSIPEFAEKLKKIDELQKQIDDIMQSIKQSDTYKQLTQTERQKQAQNNLIDRVKAMIASGAIKIDDLQ